jgi:uracil DNA glycosylase
MSEVKMEYPTWGIIADKLPKITVNINPIDAYGKKAYQAQNNPRIVRNSEEYSQQLVGIDIPVLLSSTEGSKGIIVILGESPLRTDDDKDENNNIVFGLPYAVHMDMENPPQSRMYKKVFNVLLSEGYSVYLTDIIKDWWKGRKLDPIDFDVKLFNEELEILQKKNLPITIVCFGKKAEDAIKKIGVEKFNFISLPHPSKLNWSIWKLRIFEKAVYKGNPSYAIERYPEPGSPTKENIVVNEIIAEIFEALGVSQHP